jgi:hypothetical protein
VSQPLADSARLGLLGSKAIAGRVLDVDDFATPRPPASTRRRTIQHRSANERLPRMSHVATNYESGGQEFESLRARQLRYCNGRDI